MDDKDKTDAPELSTSAATVQDNRTTLSSAAIAEQKTNATINISTTFNELEPQYSDQEIEPQITPIVNIADENKQVHYISNISTSLELRGYFSKSAPLLPIPRPHLLSPTISIGSMDNNAQGELMIEAISRTKRQHEFLSNINTKMKSQYVISSTIDQEEEKKSSLIRPTLMKADSKGAPRKVDQFLNLSTAELKKRAKQKQVSVDNYSSGRILSQPVSTGANVSGATHQFQPSPSINRQRELNILYSKMKTRTNIAYGIAFFVELIGVCYGAYELSVDRTSILGLSFTGACVGLFILTLILKCCCPVVNPMSRLGSISPTANRNNNDLDTMVAEMSQTSHSQKSN